MNFEATGNMVFQSTKENLSLHGIDASTAEAIYDTEKADMIFIWNIADQMDITIDLVSYQFRRNQIVFLTGRHKVDNINVESARVVRFNRDFYHKVDQDDEVGSEGLLFFGASKVPVITIPESLLREFEISWEMFCLEMSKRDILQRDMLESLLKRMLILCVRIFRRSHDVKNIDRSQRDIVKEFNVLVDKYFADRHDVAFYASKLNKSPKTLSNLFAAISNRTPSNIIHERIMTHARRQIHHTNLAIKEIAYQLGYDDVQSFSRFFKGKEGISPLQYREKFTAEALQ